MEADKWNMWDLLMILIELIALKLSEAISFDDIMPTELSIHRNHSRIRQPHPARQ